MHLLAPWALAGLALVPAIFLWGLWAPRGRRIVVASLLLWQRVLGAGPAGRPSARVRLRDPLLWLDAGAVLLAVLACARPALEGRDARDPVATIVIDRSAAMLARLGQADRRTRALDLVRGVLDRTGPVPARLVAVPGDASPLRVEVLADATAADVAALADAVLAPADVWAVASVEAARRPDRPVLVVTGAAPAAEVPPNVHVLASGGAAANAGLCRVAARIDGDRAWLLVAARASPGAAGPWRLRVADAQGRPARDVPDFLAPGTEVERLIPLDGPPPDALRVTLDGPPDAFAFDNEAWLVLEPDRRVRAAVVGRPEPALRRALAARGDVDVVEMPPAPAAAPPDADVVVACGAALPAGWAGPAALLVPPAGAGPLAPTAETVAADWRVDAAHPLAEALYLEPPRVADVRRYTLDPPARVLVGTRQTPLLVTWEAGAARRLAVLPALDEASTDWPRRAGFPVFWSRAIDWLVPAGARPTAYRTWSPREAALLGEARPLAPGVHGGAARRVGVSYVGRDDGFPVGPGRDDSAAAVAAVRASRETLRREALREAWPWLAAAALAVLALRAWTAR